MPSPATPRPLPIEPVSLVAIDLDGTLLLDDGVLSVRSAEAVAAAVDAGVRVVICTGRSPSSASYVYNALGLDTYMVAHNGALVLHPRRGEVLQHHTLPAELAQAVVRIARSISPELSMGVEIGDKTVIGRRGGGLAVDPTIKDVSQQRSKLEDALREPVTKVMMTAPPQVLGDVQLALHHHLGDRISFALSHMNLLQVVEGRVNKAEALTRVAARYGVMPAEVMAIGDAPNDREMMDWAGLSVAVGNAWPEIANRAHFTVPTNEQDGVAIALQRYVLGP